MATGQLQTPIARGAVRTWKGAADAIEARLEAERERIGLWLPVALGAGIGAWFALPAMMAAACTAAYVVNSAARCRANVRCAG